MQLERVIVWRCPGNHQCIEDLFDSPEQARNAIAVSATWLGVRMPPAAGPVSGWWRSDDPQTSVRA